MYAQINQLLYAFNAGEIEDVYIAKNMLLPIENIVQYTRVDLHHYAKALLKANLVQPSLQQIDELSCRQHVSPTIIARSLLLHLKLRELTQHIPSESIEQQQRTILKQLAKSLPHYVPGSIKQREDIYPTCVKVSSPLRIDLAMGGMSDVQPRTLEEPGRAVSLCAIFDHMRPNRCLVEITDKQEVYLESLDQGVSETLSTWEELNDFSSPTAIARACIVHLFFSGGEEKELHETLKSLFSGGLKIQTFSSAPKGLGSSSILSSIVLQALFRLLGHRIDWQDILHRTVTIEHMIGTEGGWEDALPAFFGGAVIAESMPSAPPLLTARKLALSAEFSLKLQDRLILYDSGIKGYTDAVLSTCILRYLLGETAVFVGSDLLTTIAQQVAQAIEEEDITQLGILLTQQWNAWKMVTKGACTSEYFDTLLQGAEPWIEGAKLNGAGSGGAILFVTKKDQRDHLLRYLQRFSGSIVNWQPDLQGYHIDE